MNDAERGAAGSSPEEFALEHARKLGAKTLYLIGEVLAKHDAGIIEGVVGEIDALSQRNEELRRMLVECLADYSAPNFTDRRHMATRIRALIASRDEAKGGGK